MNTSRFCSAVILRSVRIRSAAPEITAQRFSTPPYCSASALRRILETEHSRCAPVSAQTFKVLRSCVPRDSYMLLAEAFQTRLPVVLDDFSSFLLYKLLAVRNGSMTEYLDLSPELETRIRASLTGMTSFSGLIDAVKCRQYTRTRISRALLHLLLEIRVSDLERYREADYIPYARVLGFRKSAEPLLRQIKSHASIPLRHEAGKRRKAAFSCRAVHAGPGDLCFRSLSGRRPAKIRNTHAQ